MKWNFADDRPIYSQLIEQIKQGIISGEYELGSKLPSVRNLPKRRASTPTQCKRRFQSLNKRASSFQSEPQDGLSQKTRSSETK